MDTQRRLLIGIFVCILLIATTLVWRSVVLYPGTERASVAPVRQSPETVSVSEIVSSSTGAPTPHSVAPTPMPSATPFAQPSMAPPPSPTKSPTPTTMPTPTVEPRWIDLGDEGVFQIAGHIQIPAVQVDEELVSVSWSVREIDGQLSAVWDTVKGAVGYHRGTAPIGGPGNTVLNGHTRGDGQGEFQNLGDLARGDEIRVWDAGGQPYLYIVDSVVTLQEAGLTLEERQRNAQYVRPTEDTRLTLVTCWPEWSYTHRVIVVAFPG
jgi:LPXTG-site transpeptidase (sortase) family protein